MCALLIEDIDIVFDQDDGFIMSLQQLISSSKRPIVLTTTDYSSNVVQRFLIDYDCITFSTLQSASLATWCQIVCLVEGAYVHRGDIASLIDYNKGDMRKTLLQLQYWVLSGGQLSENRLTTKIDHESAICAETFEDDQFEVSTIQPRNDINEIFVHKDCFLSFEIFEHHDQFFIPYYINLGFIWWNIPNILGLKSYSKKRILNFNSDDVNDKLDNKNVMPKDKNKHMLKHVFNFYSSLSFADTMYRKQRYFDSLEPLITNHTSNFKDSLELDENFDDYNDLEFMHELTHTLIDGHVRSYHAEANNEVKLNVGVPEKAEIRLVFRNILISRSVCVILDRYFYFSRFCKEQNLQFSKFGDIY